MEEQFILKALQNIKSALVCAKAILIENPTPSWNRLSSDSRHSGREDLKINKIQGLIDHVADIQSQSEVDHTVVEGLLVQAEKAINEKVSRITFSFSPSLSRTANDPKVKENLLNARIFVNQEKKQAEEQAQKKKQAEEQANEVRIMNQDVGPGQVYV